MTGNTKVLNDVGIASTLIDAAVALVNGRRWSGALLLVAAALSRRVPGLGVAASVVLRIARRLR